METGHTLGQLRLCVHRHRWLATHRHAPSASCRPAWQWLFLSRLTRQDGGREPPPSSHLPQLPSPSCQPHRGVSGECVGLWGWVDSPPSPSFLLWLSKAGKMWASAFPCQRQAGEFLPHGLFLTCACASGLGSRLYFPFCGLFGAGQSEEFERQTARWTKTPGRGVLQVQADVHESRHIERQIGLTAQVNLGYRIRIPACVSNPEVAEQLSPSQRTYPRGMHVRSSRQEGFFLSWWLPFPSCLSCKHEYSSKRRRERSQNKKI